MDAQSLKSRLDEDPEQTQGWRPEVGDELIGNVVRMNERQTKDYPDPYTILTVQQEDGERLAFHAFHTVAKNLLEGDPPRVGDEIAIRYLGRTQGENYTYHDYRIVVEHSARSEAEEQNIAETQEAQRAERQAADDSVPF